MLKIKVRQMIGKNGNDVPGQFIVKIESYGVYFCSYNHTVVVVSYNDGSILLDENHWDGSRITAQYRAEFLDENTKTTRAKIKTGEYGLTNLN